MILDKKIKIVIAGAGGIGRAVGLLLAEYADFECSVFIGDRDVRIAEEAASWINTGNSRLFFAEPFHFSGDYEFLPDNHLRDSDFILDCLPGKEAPRLGAIARRYGLHYVNLTECVDETEQLKTIAADAGSAFVLQTGLAPGFVNVLANSLYSTFVSRYHNPKVEYIGMRVGALTEHAQAPHFYGFTWSPIGVATEYLKDAQVIRDYGKTTIPSLSGLSTIVINGIAYEDNFTSGGAADLPDAFAHVSKSLDYKTLRYPGHYAWVNEVLREKPEGEDQLEYLQKRMTEMIPLVESDKVVVYAVVKGFDGHGVLRASDVALTITPVQVGRVVLRAIQAATAAPMAECVRMLLRENKKGLLLQSQIDPESFLNGPFIRAVYGKEQLVKQTVNAGESVAA